MSNNAEFVDNSNRGTVAEWVKNSIPDSEVFDFKSTDRISVLEVTFCRDL